MKDNSEIERTDVATFLATLSARLRSNSLALRAIADRDHDPGDANHRELTSIADSLERTADMLELSKKHLCEKCRMMGVSERVTFEDHLEGEEKD